MVRMPRVVGIQKRNITASCFPHGTGPCCTHASIRLSHYNEPNIADALQPRHAAIGRSVINNNDFEIGECLRQR